LRLPRTARFSPTRDLIGDRHIESLPMDTMQSRIARFQLAAQAPDVLIEIPRDACQIHEFHRAGELVQVGKECTAQAFAGFRTPLREKPAAGAA
jgi:NTE family protein